MLLTYDAALYTTFVAERSKSLDYGLHSSMLLLLLLRTPETCSLEPVAQGIRLVSIISSEGKISPKIAILDILNT